MSKKARTVDWTVRFPLNLYMQVKHRLINECLLDTPHEMLSNHVFEDVSFTVHEDCDKASILNKLLEEIDKIADELRLKNKHSYPHRVSAFEVDFEGDGNKTISYP